MTDLWSQPVDQMGSEDGAGLPLMPPGPVTSTNWFLLINFQFFPSHSDNDPASILGSTLAFFPSLSIV